MSTLTSTAPHLHRPSSLDDLLDWGPIDTMVQGQSHTYGRLISKGPNGEWECGIWVCTPGMWECHVTKDEFCHFLAGRCTYEHENGDVIEVTPDTAAYFSKGWKGVCTVHETVRKTYMIK